MTNDDEMDAVAAAALLGRSPRTLADWRYFHQGPAYIKAANGRVTYRPEDLDAWRRDQLALAALPKDQGDDMSDDEIIDRWVRGELG